MYTVYTISCISHILVFSLVKMLYWMCEKTQSDPTNKQLEHAIKRNFGGHLKINAFEIFKSKISQFMTKSTLNRHVSEKVL